MIVIIDFGVLGDSGRALHNPDGIVVVPIMNAKQCCHTESKIKIKLTRDESQIRPIHTISLLDLRRA